MENGLFLTGVTPYPVSANPVIPVAPSSLTVTGITSATSLSWTNGDTYTSIAVDRSTDGVNFTALTPAAGGATTYTDSTVVLGTTYTYHVKGIKATFPSAYSNSVTATPYDPTAITGLQLWLDFSDGTTVTQVSGKVSQITDKSGNSRTFTQGTAGNRFVYSANAFNGLACATLSATNHTFMTRSSSDTALQYSAPTMICVYREGSATGSFYGYFGVAFYSGSGASSGLDLGVASANNDGISDIQNTDSSAAHNDSGITASALHAYVTTQSGTTNTIYVDGVFKGQVTQALNYNTSADAVLGRYYNTYDNFYGNDSLCECILYDHVITPTEITNISNYLKTKWGL